MFLPNKVMFTGTVNSNMDISSGGHYSNPYNPSHCVCEREREINFKELTYVIMGNGKIKI